MATQLKRIMEQQERRLASIIMTLAGYYVPRQKNPDVFDFEAMLARATNGPDTLDPRILFPMSSGGFADSLQRTMDALRETQEGIRELESAGTKRQLDTVDMFAHAIGNVRHVHQAETAGAA